MARRWQVGQMATCTCNDNPPQQFKVRRVTGVGPVLSVGEEMHMCTTAQLVDRRGRPSGKGQGSSTIRLSKSALLVAEARAGDAGINIRRWIEQAILARDPPPQT